MRFNFKKKHTTPNMKKTTHHTCTLMQRSHCIRISSFLPQSTGILPHFRVCSKKLKTFSLVFDRKTCSLNIPHTFKILLFGDYKTSIKRMDLFFWLLRLLSSISGTGKKICIYRATQPACTNFQTKAVCELDWQ